MARRKAKKKGVLGDVILTILTGGLWLVVLFIRFLKGNTD